MASSNLHKYSVQEALNILTGGGGYDVVTAATVNTHTYVAIYAVTAPAVITTVSEDTDIWDTITALSLVSGTWVYGRWSSVQVGADDTAIVYRAYSTD